MTISNPNIIEWYYHCNIASLQDSETKCLRMDGPPQNKKQMNEVIKEKIGDWMNNS